MSGAAQRDDIADDVTYAATGTDGGGAAALQQIAAERLAAHRRRRAVAEASEAEAQAHMQARRDETQRGASRVREAVAARYQQSVSYREFLAAEAERALQQAQAEAEVAARNAQAVAEAQMKLMEELEQWNRPEPGPREELLASHKAEVRGDLAHALADIALGARELMAEPPLLTIVEAAPAKPRAARSSSSVAAEISTGGLKVQLFEDFSLTHQAPPARAGRSVSFESEGELEQLDQEIEFRLSPEFVDHAIEAMPIPANLIEFPRQLVAPRKARPRLAEGPLREEAELAPQLRIFEVEAEAISVEPVISEPTAAPEWQSLHLGAGTHAELAVPPDAQLQFAIPPQAAPIELRAMALAVDFCCVATAFLGFACVTAILAGHILLASPLPWLAGAAVGVLAMLGLLYQGLFFTLAEATPGMRFARIGFCTFGDGNPTRKALRRRIFATMLAACPLGLGLAWMAMDADRLGWHDRMSRMYPRAY